MTPLPAELTLKSASDLAQIPARTLYLISQLRQQVFVCEQQCVYLDLDGRDLEPGCQQFWAEAPDGTIAATIRVLSEDALEPGLRSIGRVATAPQWRGHGVAAALIDAGIRACEGHPIQIHAQSYLVDWYARFGFVTSGPEFLEDNIPHTPMRRA